MQNRDIYVVAGHAGSALRGADVAVRFGNPVEHVHIPETAADLAAVTEGDIIVLMYGWSCHAEATGLSPIIRRHDRSSTAPTVITVDPPFAPANAEVPDDIRALAAWFDEGPAPGELDVA